MSKFHAKFHIGLNAKAHVGVSVNKVIFGQLVLTTELFNGYNLLSGNISKLSVTDEVLDGSASN